MFSCNTNKATKQLPEEVKISVASRSGLPTLSYFQNYPKGSVTVIPENYVPQKQGIWDYTNVYLFTQTGSEVVMELYEFETQYALEQATSENLCDLWDDDDTSTPLNCSGGGHLCSCGGGDDPSCVPLSIM